MSVATHINKRNMFNLPHPKLFIPLKCYTFHQTKNNINVQSMIGKIISHYKIVEKIGEGGMGIVYKARDVKLDRFVALKFLPPHMGRDDNQKQRFIHEAKAA